MTFRKLVIRSLRYYWRTNLAVAAGVAVAVAVLVGSLLVGDSVTGSLRRLALERLARTDYALSREGFFREALADDLRTSAALSGEEVLCVPAVLLEGSVKHPETGAVVGHVTVLGVREDFWRLAEPSAPVKLSGRSVAVNRWLAEDLGVGEGDAVLVSVGRRSAAPMTTVFGRRGREDTVRTRRVVVGRVLPTGGLGRFTLRADRPRPRNLYVSLEWLQMQLEEPERVNTLLIASGAGDAAPGTSERLEHALAAALSLDDYDLSLEADARRRRLTLKSARLVLSPTVVRAADEAARESKLIATLGSVYLANTLAGLDGGEAKTVLPYSLVAAFDIPSVRPFKRSFPDVERANFWLAQPSAGEIVLNEWAAADLAARLDDEVTATFYVWGSRGELASVSRTFRLRGVVPLEGFALDRSFVPEFEGMTDSENMADWAPPFPIDLDLIRPKDETYWTKYHTTPKAFVPAETLRALWGASDADAPAAGWATAFWAGPSEGDAGAPDEAAFKRHLLSRLSPADAGLALRAVKAEALQAAKASTDFGVLFLLMSFFLVAAAAGLIWLLLRLTVDRRAGEIGLLLASGFTQRAAARILVGEAMLVALAGGAVGVPLGVGYAAAIITALRTTWSGAVAEFPLELHVTAFSVVVGAASGLVVAAAAILLSSRILRRLSALVLMGGWRAVAAGGRPSAARTAKVVGVAALAVSALLLALWGAFGLLPAALAFATSGALILVGLLALLSGVLQRRPRRRAGRTQLSLLRLALRGASRHWVRSLLTVGLLAAATLIVVTVAAFRRNPARQHPGPKESGSGGFNLLARSDIPLYADLNSVGGRRELGFAPEASRRVGEARIFRLRMSAGGDVSCLNLQRPKTPRVLGVPDEMIERGGFKFSAHEHLEATGGTPANVWTLLRAEPADGAVPAFADADTAQWQLKVALGETLKVPTPDGKDVTLRIVGLMPGSLFAGELLISEANFIKHFGGESGYRFFLVACPTAAEDEVASALRETLGEFGIDVRRTSDVLAAYADVQNTYLSAFETLGGLGLVLATFGIVTVLLRSVIERRSELAMLTAVGFTRRAVTSLVLMENAVLLVAGVCVGAAAALVAAGPQLVSTAADVNWLSLAGTLGATLAVGVVSCTVAARASLRGELVAALRSE